MADPSTEFFTKLAERGHERLWEEVSGTMRVDLVRNDRTDHWFVTIDDGDVEVSQAEEPADCVLRMDGANFDQIATGNANVIQSWLQGEIFFQGSMWLTDQFIKVFPGPSEAQEPRQYAEKGHGINKGKA